MDQNSLLHALVQAAKGAFGADLTGVYLHGSLAMGCFNPKKSDLDLLVVVETPPTPQARLAFLNDLVALNRLSPAKGIELSVLERSACKPFRHPCPYVFHFSPTHLPAIEADPAGYVQAMVGTDRDLAAHCTVLHQYGRVLCGAPIHEVFGPVSVGDYGDSILSDVGSALEDVDRDPVYVILNLCRTLAFFRQGLCLSKAQGGAWALDNLLTDYRPLIQDALDCYGSDREMELTPLCRLFAVYALGELGWWQEQ